MIRSFKRSIRIDDFLSLNQQDIINLTCSICDCILCTPVCDQNGHLFCKQCALDFISNKEACPKNNKCCLSLDSITEVPLISSILMSKEIRCINKHTGCNWAGLFSLLTNHLSSHCLKQEVACLFQSNGCKLSLLREKLPGHTLDCPYRLIQCRNHCALEELIIFKEEEKHLAKCPNELMSCPNGCGATFQRKEVDGHCNECPQALFPCGYEAYGCAVKVLKANWDEHIALCVHQHNTLVIAHVTKTEAEMRTKIQCIHDMERQLNDKIDKCFTMVKKLVVYSSELTGKEDSIVISINDKENENDITFLANKKGRESNGNLLIDNDNDEIEEVRRRKRDLAKTLSNAFFAQNK